MVKHQTTMYRQGRGWIVSRWSDHYQAYELSHEMPYAAARAVCGRENCRSPRTCKIPEHQHQHQHDQTA